jgi:epoxyqueuosine reductase QueG
MGIISLKHSAVLCGLGKMGKNTLLVNEKFGNMLWLAGMLTSAELEPDPMAEFEPCGECTLCLDICPVSALDGVTIKQSVCRSFAFGSRDGGEWRIHCFECRRACPNSLGLR